nr:MAG TPA: hypothetical protein [Caudoviricetes sp.]
MCVYREEKNKCEYDIHFVFSYRKTLVTLVTRLHSPESRIK